MTYLEIEAVLSGLVSPKRLAHILRVADTAKALASMHGEDPEKAYLAGLLHDTAKQLTPAMALEKGVPLSASEIALYNDYPKPWHAFVAPTVCRFLFSIQDNDVLDATKWHTTGTHHMSALQQIVFIADYIEPGREVSDHHYIRDLAMKSLDQGTFALSCSTLVSLCERGLNIHPESLACYNHYHSVLSRAETEEVAATIFRLKFSKVI